MKTIFLIFICLFSILVGGQANAQSLSGKRVGLIETLIGDIIPADFGQGGDIYNYQVKTNSKKILEILKQNVENYREIYAQALQNKLNCDVIYGKNLVNSAEYKDIASRFNFQQNLVIEDGYLRKIVIPMDETNLFKFKDEKVPLFLEDYYQYKKPVSEICTSLNCELVAVSITQLQINFSGYIRLKSALYLYNNKGSMIASGKANTDAIQSNPDEIWKFEGQIKNLPSIIDQIMKEVVKDLNKKGHIIG
jgi:hypothetical protein